MLDMDTMINFLLGLAIIGVPAFVFYRWGCKSALIKACVVNWCVN